MNKALIYVLCFFSIISCTKSITSLDSREIFKREKRIEILEKEIRTFSKIIDADFSLFNVNGLVSGNMPLAPGATSYNYEFVVKVKRENLKFWIQGLKQTEHEVKTDWIKSIASFRPKTWATNTKPKYYTRVGDSNVSLVVYFSEGIIFKKITQE